jgi:hypothetical protein
MNVLFFTIALAMSIFAMAIVTRPLTIAPGNRDKGFARLPVLIIVAVLLLAIGLYAIIGRPDAAFSSASGDSSMGISQSATSSTSDKKVGSIASLLGGLEQRLQSEPNDADGWLLLAKSYQRLGKTAEAGEAYAKARALGQSDATLEASLAGNPPPEKPTVEIRGRVSISPNSATELNGTATVFVLAKATNGSPMPLAVLKRPVSELPFEFTLTDEMSMVRGSGISSVAEVIVTAKISTTGDALQTEPGYEVHSQPIATADSPYLELEMDPSASTEDL